MLDDDSLTHPSASSSYSPSANSPDAEFDARWAAWIARGRIHEQQGRRRFAIGVAVLAIGAAIAYAVIR